MTDETDRGSIDLTRRRALASLTTLGVASAAAGAGTMAYFSDSESSDGTVQAGTLTLDVGDEAEELSNGEWGAQGSADFDFGPVAPGDTVTKDIVIANEGNLNADVFKTEFSVTDKDGLSTAPERAAEKDKEHDNDISNHIKVKIFFGTHSLSSETGYPTDITSQVASGAGVSGTLYLSDLDGYTMTYDPGLNATTNRGFRYEFTLEEGTGNAYQGDKSEIDMTVTLLQEDGK